MKASQITLDPTAITRSLGIVTLLLVVAGVAGQLSKYLLGHDNVMGLVPLFYVDNEENIPNFFSMSLLLFAALLLAVIARLNRQRRTPWVWNWSILSFGFCLMAYDEAFQLHETLTRPVEALLGNGHLGMFHFAWVVPGIALVVVLGLSYLKFLWHLPADSRIAFLVAAAIYLGGAIGFEMIGGSYADTHGIQNMTYSMLATIEETLEMVGAIVFIRALLIYIANTHGGMQFDIVGIRPGAAGARPPQ